MCVELKKKMLFGFLPIFWRKFNIFHCLVCIYYGISTYFLKKILLSLFFSQIWRMSSGYDEEHFTWVSFPFYAIKSCHKPHLKFVLVLNNIYANVYCSSLSELISWLFFKVNVIFYWKLILSAFKWGIGLLSCVHNNYKWYN